MEVKAILIGDVAVGKTSIAHCAVGHEINDIYQPTQGADAFRVELKNENQEDVIIRLWDTAGQENFRALVKTYFRNASIVFLVFDLTSRESFIALNDWIESVNEQADENIVRVLVGNKCDLRSERKVEFSEADSFSREIDCVSYFEVSAKTGENVKAMFDDVVNHVCIPHETNQGEIHLNQTVTENNTRNWWGWLSHCSIF